MTRKTLAQAVAEALDAMPEDRRRAFALMVLHGIPMKKVAAETGATFESLQDEVTSAMKEVRAHLQAAGYGADDLAAGRQI